MKKCLLIIATVLLIAKADAQSLGNDFCSTAFPLTVGAACTFGDNIGATLNNDFNFSCGDAVDAAIWFSFVAPASGSVNVTTDFGATTFDTQINILGGAAGDPTACPVPPNMFEYGCDDDGGTGTTSDLTVVGLVPGQTYWIQLDGFAAATGNFCIEITSVPCTANAGTFSLAGAGNANVVGNVIYACEDGTSCFDILSNNDYTLPTGFASNQSTFPFAPCVTVPELMYAIYINTPPNSNPADPDNDPGWPGLYWTGQDYSDCNPTGVGGGFFGAGDIVYFVPITADDGNDDGPGNGCGGLQTDGNNDGCYAVGPTFSVYYLNETVATMTASNGCLGTVNVEVVGGMPQVDGSDYTITNTGNGTLTGTPITHAQIVVITGLTNGQAWSLNITDPNGCPETINGVFVGNPDSPTWTNPTPICESAGNINLNTLITGTGGGSWSGTGVAGNTFNPTGLSGPINVTYSVGACPKTLMQAITVVPDVDPAWTSPGTICENAGIISLTPLVTGTAGGTWSGTGVSGTNFDPSGLSGPINVTYTVGAVPCVENSMQAITVVPDVDPAWTSPGTICENAGIISLTPLVTGTAGGTWSGTGVSGTNFDPSGLSGPINVTYTVGGVPCTENSMQAITVVPDVDPAWTSPGTICENAGIISLTPLVTGTAGGSWSGTGVSGTNFDPSGLSGPINVTYTVGGVPCTENSMQAITVVPDVDPAWTSPGTICENAGIISLTPLVTGTAGGSWSGTGVSGTNFDPSGLSGPINVTYTVGGVPCTENSMQAITVVPDVDPAWTSPGTICENAGIISLTPLVTGTAGGTWSGTGVSGTNFDPSGLSGPINVTYTIGAVPCVENSMQAITVVPDVDPAWTSPGTICENAGIISLTPLVTGTAGGSWSGTGVSGTNFDPSGLSGPINVTYTVGGVPCTENSMQAITVVPDVDPAWTSPGTICENAGIISLTPFVTGTAGGTWSGTGVSGTNFDPSGLSGPINVTYTVGAVPCVENSMQAITVVPDVDPTWSNPGPLCEGSGIISLTPLVTGTAGGTWSGTGVTGTNFDPTGLSGPINVTYTIGAVPCVENLMLAIQVDDEDDPSFSYSAALFCSWDTDPIAIPGGTQTAGGTYTISAPGVINAADGTINLAASGAAGSPYTVTYTTPGINPCPNATNFIVAITTAPNAGTDNTLGICATGSPIDLFTLLGVADVGGTWDPVLTSGTGVFDPATDPAATYQYIVLGAAPCADDTADVVVNITANDDPTFVYPDFCEGAGGVPGVINTPGGTFTFNPDPGDGATIVPGTGAIANEVAGGVYSIQYLTPPGPCQDSLTIAVTVGTPVNAGTNTTLTTCSTSSTTDLFPLLGGADLGGAWLPVMTSGTGVFDPATDAAVTYTYTVTGTNGCPNVNGDVAVTINTAANAGTDNTLTTCATSSTTDLFTLLGVADLGGTWVPAMASGTGVFDPALDAGAIYQYVIIGLVPCADDTADVVVTVNPAANAGTDNTLGICATGSPIDLFTLLGVADGGGTWLPSMASGTGMFDPAVDAAATYQYIVTGLVPCSDDTADVVVSITANDDPTFVYPDFCAGAGGVAGVINTPGGTFTFNPDPGDGATIVPGTGAIANEVAGGAYSIQYLTPAGPCQDSLTLVVNIGTPANAGTDNTLATCGAAGTTDLFNLLGVADVGGTWVPAMASGTGVFDPAVDAGATYQYVIIGVAPCGDDTADVVVTITATDDPTFTYAGFCANAGGIAGVINTPGGTFSYNPDPTDGSSINPTTGAISNGVSGSIYNIQYLTPAGSCQDSLTIPVIVGGVVANINATPISGSIPLNVTLDGTGSTGAISYGWDLDGDGTTEIFTPTTGNIYTATGTYTVMLVVSDGLCVDTTFVTIDAFGESTVIIPNVFTPNGDGENDVFTVEGVNLESVVGEIFNRWGQKMFSWNNVKGHWDGRTLSSSEAPDGTYFYIITAKGFDGTEYFKKGGFSLIR